VSTKAGGCGASSPAASTPAQAEAAAAAAFDLDQPWRIDGRVAVRPEPFGALLYHFGTRRLSFLKNTTVLTVVRSLADHPSAREACAAAGVTPAALPAYERALATLAASQMIMKRGAAGERGTAGADRGTAAADRGTAAADRGVLATGAAS
jgi:mycofactocin biosynthesis protein MftB